MEPQSNSPENRQNNTPERSINTPEISGDMQSRKLDHIPIGAMEQLGESTAEKSQTSDVSAQAIFSDASSLPGVAASASDDTVSPTSVADPTGVTLANDDDVIEKEWVNKAKHVISTTKGDPYEKEKEVSKLQADYMQKRYGKQVKIPEEK